MYDVGCTKTLRFEKYLMIRGRMQIRKFTVENSEFRRESPRHLCALLFSAVKKNHHIRLNVFNRKVFFPVSALMIPFLFKKSILTFPEA